MQYELRVEVWNVTEWKDGTVYTTVSQGEQWVDMATVDANIPKETNLVYAPPSNPNQVIRVKR